MRGKAGAVVRIYIWFSHFKLSNKTDCPIRCTHIFSNMLADLPVDATKLSVGQIGLGRIKWIQSQEISVKQLSASSRQKNMYMHGRGLPTDYEIAFWSWETQRCLGFPRARLYAIQMMQLKRVLSTAETWSDVASLNMAVGNLDVVKRRHYISEMSQHEWQNYLCFIQLHC
jgi:hypothetical protein